MIVAIWACGQALWGREILSRQKLVIVDDGWEWVEGKLGKKEGFFLKNSWVSALCKKARQL